MHHTNTNNESTHHHSEMIVNQEYMLYNHHQHSLTEIAQQSNPSPNNVMATNKNEGGK